MTQKELLYVEDAIEHERSIIKICEESLTKTNDENFVSYFEKEINLHQNMEEALMNLLKEEVNE